MEIYKKKKKLKTANGELEKLKKSVGTHTDEAAKALDEKIVKQTQQIESIRSKIAQQNDTISGLQSKIKNGKKIQRGIIDTMGKKNASLTENMESYTNGVSQARLARKKAKHGIK